MIGAIIRGIVNAVVSPVVNFFFDAIIAPVVNFLVSCFLPLFLSLFLIVASLWLWYFGLLAAIQAWQIVKLEIVLAFTIGVVNELIANELIIPQIEILATGFAPVLPIMFNVALVILGMTYVLAAFWVKNLNLVDWKRAIAWLLAGIFFYTYTAELFTSFEVFRRGAGDFVYGVVLQLDYDPDPTETATNWAGAGFTCVSVESGLTDSIDAFSYFTENVSGEDASNLAEWGCLTDWFGASTNTTGISILEYDQGIDAIDITFAFVMADPTDLLLPIPLEYFTYFYIDNFISVFLDYTFGIGDDDSNGVFLDQFENIDFGSLSGDVSIDLEDSIDTSVIGAVITAWGRMYAAQFMGAIGILEQVVYMIFTVGYGVVFWALMFFLPLAFFVPTEKFAMAAVKQFIEMFWSFLFAQFMIALGIGIMIAGAGLKYPPAIQAFAYIAACPAVVGVLTASNAFMGMIKGITSVISSAAAQGVEQGFALSKQVAVGKASALGNKLGIGGADKAVGPGAGSNALGGKPGAQGGGGALGPGTGGGLGGGAAKPEPFVDKKAEKPGGWRQAWNFTKGGGKFVGRRLMDFSGLGLLSASGRERQRARNSWATLGKVGASPFRAGWWGAKSAGRMGKGLMKDSAQALVYQFSGRWGGKYGRASFEATKGAAGRAWQDVKDTKKSAADTMRAGSNYMFYGDKEGWRDPVSKRLKERGLDENDKEARQKVTDEINAERQASFQQQSGGGVGGGGGMGGDTAGAINSLKSSVDELAKALRGGPTGIDPMDNLRNNFRSQMTDLQGTTQSIKGDLASDIATVQGLSDQKFTEVLQEARQNNGKVLSIDLKTTQAGQILQQLADAPKKDSKEDSAAPNPSIGGQLSGKPPTTPPS